MGARSDRVQVSFFLVSLGLTRWQAGKTRVADGREHLALGAGRPVLTARCYGVLFDDEVGN